MSVRRRAIKARVYRDDNWRRNYLETSAMLNELRASILYSIFEPDRAADDGWPP